MGWQHHRCVRRWDVLCPPTAPGSWLKKLRSSGELEKRRLHCSWQPLKAALRSLQRKQQHPRHSVPPSPACSLQCPTTGDTHWAAREAVWHLHPIPTPEQSSTPFMLKLKRGRREWKLSVQPVERAEFRVYPSRGITARPHFFLRGNQ